MEIEEAIRVVRAMADGLDPETHESLAPESLCRKSLVVKALNRAIGALIAQHDREQNRPTGAGKYWTGKEDAEVCDEVRKGMDFRDIAKAHNRSVPSIVARLVKLGKIAPAKNSRENTSGRAA